MIALVLTLAIVAGCAGSGPAWNATDIVRTSSETPDRFQALAHPEAVDLKPGDPCRSPLVDPRDGTRITLARSVPGFGDYEVPPGRYGIPDPRRELLRVDCGTGRPVGVVRM